MTSLLQDSRLTELRTRIPAIADAVGIRLLDGGLTNRNYRVDTPSASFVLRISHANSSLLGINRENERVNTARAHLAGVGPAVIASLPEENVLVISWIEATALHAADFHVRPALLSDVATALQKLHRGPAFQGHFHFPDVRGAYAQTVKDNRYFIPAGYLQLEPQVRQLEELLARHPEELVPCNNDLLAENFLDDGEKIWIIDYEYAGQNEASFEIGNLAAESALSDAGIGLLCDKYWGTHNPYKIARAMAWSMIARYGWTLWASIQEAISPIEFDFRSWGMRKWDSVCPDLNGNHYTEILSILKNQNG